MPPSQGGHAPIFPSGGGRAFNNSATRREGFYAKATAESSGNVTTTTSPMVSNSIMWENGGTGAGADIWQNQPGGSITNSILQADGANDIVVYTDTVHRDPLFMSTTMGSIDLRLMPGSPAFNTGINDSIQAGITTDKQVIYDALEGTVLDKTFEVKAGGLLEVRLEGCD